MDVEGHKEKAYRVAQDWRAHRIPKLPQVADTKTIAVLTEIAFGTTGGDEVDGL
jgi:hypothetical protein